MKTILMILLLLPVLVFGTTTEATYTFSNSNLEGAVHRLDLTDSETIGAWEWRNHLTFKSSQDQDALRIDLLRNYVRDRLDLSHYGKNLYVNAFGGFDLYGDQNVAGEIAGWPGQYRNKLGALGGMNAELRLGAITIKGSGSYSEMHYKALRTYDQDTLTILPDNPADRNLSTSGEIEWRSETGFRPYVKIDHYNDLNESNVGNVSWYRAGFRYQRKFTPIWNLNHDLSAGATDYYDDIPYFVEINERVTVKLGPRWAIVQRLYGSIWTSEKFDESYTGDNFAETMVQRTFGFDSACRTNRLQAAAKFYADGWTAVRCSGEGHVGRYVGFAEYHHYLGDNPIRTDLMEVQAGADVWKLRLTAGYRQEHMRKRADQSTFLMQLSYLQP
jgi:hypothetical protein